MTNLALGADGWPLAEQPAGRLVSIEELESPNQYRRYPADESLLRALTVKPRVC
jgi:hypothetical protein